MAYQDIPRRNKSRSVIVHPRPPPDGQVLIAEVGKSLGEKSNGEYLTQTPGLVSGNCSELLQFFDLENVYAS